MPGLSTTIPRQYRRYVTAAARDTGLPAGVIAAQIDDESGWDPKAQSGAGAEGIAQFEPGTWAQWGTGSPYNPADAFPAYAAYMSSLLSQFGNVRDALAAYNAGPADLQAGYPYADRILSAAGLPQGGPAVYRDPFRDVQGLSGERVDMGVDLQGTGPVYAVGPGVITEADTAWAGGVGAVGPGTFITEKLTAGPAAGHYVYLAENVTPEVQVGQRVGTGTVIGRMTGQGAGIETGWAAGPTGATTAAMQAGQSAPGPDPGAWPTAYGAAYNELLRKLGNRGGVQTGKPVGAVPGWLSWLKEFIPGVGGLDPGGGSGGGGGILGIPADIGSALSSIADTLGKAEQAVEWFLVPNHWVRIFCGFFGTGLVAWGLWAMSRTGRAYSATIPVAGQVPVPEGGQLAPAMGIGAVTTGSVLLFVAFHNLPASVTDFPSFIGHLQAGLKGGTGAT